MVVGEGGVVGSGGEGWGGVGWGLVCVVVMMVVVCVGGDSDGWEWAEVVCLVSGVCV